MKPAISREDAIALDAADELTGLRHEFFLPEDLIYLDGNSLGPLSRSVADRVDAVMRGQWGNDLIRSWNLHGWIDLPLAVGDAIAPLIGAVSGEVVVADSTSVNLFKLLSAALGMRPERRVILSERENFPTDLYIAQGLTNLLGDRVELRVVGRSELGNALDETVAVLMLTHVDFRSGELHDMAARTEAAHDVGALALWDLSHSAGAVNVDLRGCGADFAVGCGYKYLNGGPGAPAFAFVAHHLQDRLQSPLWGWLGHASPFELALDYQPAPGMARLICGTPPILSLVALAAAVDIIGQAGIARLRRKSVALTDLFITLMDGVCERFGFALASPRDGERRGSQVAYRHPEGYSIMQALIHDGVVGDFRAPDLLRFGFAPAYVRFVDVYDAVLRLVTIMAERRWDRAEYKERAKVT